MSDLKVKLENTDNSVKNLEKDNQKEIKSDINPKKSKKRKKSKKPRCFICKKKLLIPYNCRCEKVFCPKHVHTSDHGCTFDYRKYHRDLIEKENPLIENSKFEKI